MKYNKPKTKSNLNNQNINNVITTFNLKIKDIHILLDDLDTKNKKNNLYESQKSLLFKKNSIRNHSDFSPFSTISSNKISNKIYYHKRSINSLKTYHNSMSVIPLNLKNSYFCISKNLGTTPSLSTAIDRYDNSNLNSIISRKNNLSNLNTDRIIYSKKSYKEKNYIYNSKSINSNGRNNNKTDSFIKYFNSDYQKFPKKNIYIKKRNNKKLSYKFNTSNNVKPFLLTCGSPKNFISKISDSKNFIDKNISISSEIDNKIDNINKKIIKKKKISFNSYKENNIKNEKKSFNNNKNYSLYLKSSIIIQKWWKNIKSFKILKYFVILIQKFIRGYLLRKKFKSNLNNNNSNFIKKIIKLNNSSNLYYISKNYYKNNMPNLILIQREIKKFLFKLKIYKYNIHSKNSNLEYSLVIRKPKINICFISKIINKTKKKISFINKKIKFITENQNSKIIKKGKSYSKIILNTKSMNDLSNSFLSNISGKNCNLIHNNNNITIQTIDSKESQDFFRCDNLKKNKINKNNIAFYYFQNLFTNNIFHKLYLILLKMKYNYINISNFLKAIFNSIMRYKKRIFFQNMTFYDIKYYNAYKRKENFFNVLIRHINVYKKNNNIKNEIIKFIENNLPEYLNIKFNKENEAILQHLSNEQEYKLINTQLFKNDDNGLINYITLFFKFEKNKNYINSIFIQNRLIKEPLKYRNIFTITRYIDSLDNKINNKKICMKCFCKKNEKNCKLNCNCHYVQNIINGNCLNNFMPKSKIRKCSLKKYNLNINKENTYIFQNRKFFDKNIDSKEKDNTKEGNRSEEFHDSQSMNISEDSLDNKVNMLHIKKAYTYFGE